MLGLLRGELVKIFKHYRLTSFLVWIYPVGAAAFYFMLIPLSVISEGARQGIADGCPADWTTDSLGSWGMLFEFPGSVFGRLLPLAFMAVLFAGEYEWGTLKHIIPRIRRHQLILSKMIALTLVVALSFVILSAVVAIGQAVGCRIIGERAGPALSTDALDTLIREYSQQTLLGLLALLLMSSFASVAAVLTKSILGGLLVSFGLSLLDLLSLGLFFLLRTLLGIPEILELYVFTPSYSFGNMQSWMQSNQALPGLTPDSPIFTTEPSLLASIVLLTVWISGFTALSIAIFQRQDITS